VRACRAHALCFLWNGLDFFLVEVAFCVWSVEVCPFSGLQGGGGGLLWLVGLSKGVKDCVGE
jgi:hypothetical protein